MNPEGETTSLRDRSREEVYALIVRNPGITRPAVAAATGLSRSAVAHAVNRLVAADRVHEVGVGGGGPGAGSGRPAVGLHPTARAPVAGLDFGHTHLAVALADGLGTIYAERRISLDVDHDAHQAMDTAADLLRRLLEETGTGRVSRVVAGIPGPIATRTGLVTSPTILSGWIGLAPAAELERRLGVVVHVENDAVLGGYAELKAGAGRGHRDFLYVKAANGIGAALVLDGRSYTGSSGIAGEIGHTRLPASTELCRCGDRGCLEAVVSVQAVRRQLSHTHPGADPVVSARSALSDFDDDVSARVFAEAGRTIGQVLAASCNLINPSAIILGGELGTASPALLEGVRSAIASAAQPATAAAVEVLTAELGSRAELTGAIRLAAALALDDAAALRP